MVLNINGDPVNMNTSNAALSVNRNSYFFAGFLNQTIHSCELHGTSVNNIAGTAPAVTTQECEPKQQAQTDDPCISYYPRKAKLNFYLLVMNGARLVFAKTLAFNTLLTIRALMVHL